MQCPNCQHWNEAGARFCEECGVQLPEENDAAARVSVRPAAPDHEEPAQVPPVPLQNLIPIDEPAPVPYTGPHLVLQATGSIFKLGTSAVIGREDPALQIDLDGYPEGKYISHRHAQIVKINDKYYVEDLGSSNHTYVNERKLAQGQAEPLTNGDVIRLAKIELVFHDS